MALMADRQSAQKLQNKNWASEVNVRNSWRVACLTLGDELLRTTCHQTATSSHTAPVYLYTTGVFTYLYCFVCPHVSASKISKCYI